MSPHGCPIAWDRVSDEHTRSCQAYLVNEMSLIIRTLTRRRHLAGLVVHVRQVGVLQRLLHGDAAPRVELQHAVQQVDARRARVREGARKVVPLRAAAQKQCVRSSASGYPGMSLVDARAHQVSRGTQEASCSHACAQPSWLESSIFDKGPSGLRQPRHVSAACATVLQTEN